MPQVEIGNKAVVEYQDDPEIVPQRRGESTITISLKTKSKEGSAHISMDEFDVQDAEIFERNIAQGQTTDDREHIDGLNGISTEQSIMKDRESLIKQRGVNKTEILRTTIAAAKEADTIVSAGGQIPTHDEGESDFPVDNQTHGSNVAPRLFQRSRPGTTSKYAARQRGVALLSSTR